MLMAATDYQCLGLGLEAVGYVKRMDYEMHAFLSLKKITSVVPHVPIK